jgi:uncharacterized protein
MASTAESAEVAELARAYGLAPLPAEGGLFRQTWAGPPLPDGRPSGTAIIFLLAATEDMFSALHRLPIDETWHHYRGDPVEMLLLSPDGRDQVVILGAAVPGGLVQLTVPAGTWMGARVAPGGRWSLCGTTMAPGFLPADYEGADPRELRARYPRHVDRIHALCRPGAPRRMDGTPA